MKAKSKTSRISAVLLIFMMIVSVVFAYAEIGTADFFVYADTIETPDTTEPADTVDPENPVDPANPEDPENPADPADPEDPENPTDPTDPEDPADPTEPADPTDPTEPTEPSEPENPVDPAETPNLAKAMEKYGVSIDAVLWVEDIDDIGSYLKEASLVSQDYGRAIVYLPSGQYKIEGHINVLQNIVLVAEDDSVITPASTDSYLVRLSGSMYGGTYDSNYKNQTTIRILENSSGFSNGNGQIEYLTVLRSNYYGIVAQGSKGSKINRCNVSKCKASGIAALKPSGASGAGATKIESITYCNVSNNGQKGEGAGINLSFADVGTIANCTINSNSDKAVSTNSDSRTGCHIGTIRNCTMKKNGNNGVHIKPNCRLDHFINNTMIANDDGLVAAAITKEGTKGKSIIKDVRGNTFKQSRTQQIEAQGSGASITIGDGNTIVSGKGYGILVMKYGKVNITGSKNIIKANDKGIGAQTHGAVKITGKKNQILSNKKYGIQAVTKAVISITGSGNKISGNKKSAVYCASKAKITLKKVKISGKIYKTGGGKVVKK